MKKKHKILSELNQIETGWHKLLNSDIKEESFTRLMNFLDSEYSNKEIFPPVKDIFNSLNLCSLKNTKVVIIGQDPYHGQRQAHGLAFSVQRDVKIPPSLKNIYKEIQHNFGHEIPTHGNLDSWAKQGVLLLNRVLTVESGKAGSHHGQGWEKFTEAIIEKLSNQKSNLVFFLWGMPAQKNERIIASKHLILKSVHPSPLSAYRGFFKNNHFKLANSYLIKHGKKPIDWKIT